MARLLGDALRQALQPIYNITEFPDLAQAPVPRASQRLQRRYLARRMATIDTSRAAFNCSFCTIINVQGRKMRYRPAERVLEAVEDNYAAASALLLHRRQLSRNPAWARLRWPHRPARAASPSAS